uniref:CID domain-containing protein n=1 Tax=Globisporangium ultimum (strain ATCC 200006 / CBS 805.95 / DAOM BR144) TaxID=431595 RepID=K3X223_GLOUD
MGDNWNLDVKFQGRSIGLVGRLPAEKRVLLKDFPRKLVVSTKAKLAAIPHKGFFCKFFAKHGEEMKMYMKKNECALCVQFVASTYNFTLYLIVPVSLKGLKCLHRLRKSGASEDSIKSLCTDRDGVMIGFIVSEVNSELEEKMHERQKVMQELVSTAKAMSNTFGDPMLEFDLLIDQLDTKPSAIQVCSKFIIRHQSLHERIREKLCETIDTLQTSKGKSNIIYVVHDVIKSVRAGFPQNERNAKMRESPLVTSLGKVLYTLVQKLPEDARHCTNIRAVFDFWKKWGLEFSKPAEVEHESSKAEETMAKIDETFEILEKESNLLSDASTSPVKQIASAEVLALMKTHGIQPGPWEVYLSRATTQELEELDTVLTLNTKYYRFNNWDASDKGHRKCGEYFLHQYVKLHMPLLLKHSFKGSSSKRKRDLEPLQIYKQAFLCTWDLDQAAHRAVSDVERSVLDDIWKKMETEKCLNASAFVFGKIRRLKTIHFAKNPEIEAISKSIEDQDKLNTEKLVADMVRVFKLDTMAREGLKKVKARADLYKIAKELCDRCRHHMVANPSVHIVKLCQKAVAEKNPKKSYSSAMKSMMFRQMKLSALFAKEAQKKRKLENASPSTENDSSESSHADLTDAELAAVKRRIPKPPKLNFKKVDLSTITYRETNDNGTVGVAVSGIPNAGRGLFNLSDHAWPAFSVVCIFGVRRITKEQHHDGLNKVARCGELGETFVVVNGVIRDVEKFQTQYGHRLVPFDGLVDADGSVGGFPNDRVYEYPADVYWDASGFYNNCILVPGCIIENPQDPNSPITLNQLYIVTWKEVAVREEFFLAYGTSYYEEDEKDN